MGIAADFVLIVVAGLVGAIVARALDLPLLVGLGLEISLRDLRALGVEGAVQPECEGGVEMVRQALRHYRHEDAAIDRLTGRLRRELYGQEPTAK